MRKTIQAASGRDSKLSSLMPRREEMEKRLLRTGKGWTVTQYMLASMGVFVIFTGALLVLRTPFLLATLVRSEEHTSELQSLMRISYAVFCLKTKKQQYA